MTGDLIGTIVIVGLASIGLLWLFNKALGFVYSAVSSWMDRRRLMLRTVRRGDRMGGTNAGWTPWRNTASHHAHE